MDNRQIDNLRVDSLEADIKKFISEFEPKRRISEFQTEYGIIASEEGRILQMFIEISNAKSVLEIGTSIGISTLWIGMGLLKTGGKLISIEIKPEHEQLAKENFKKFGREIEDIITIIEGDAFNVLPTLNEKFDFVFSDAYKVKNLAYFNLFMPLVVDGGIIVAHDAISEADNMRDYLDVVENHPLLRTFIIGNGDQCGLAISYKNLTSKI